MRLVSVWNGWKVVFHAATTQRSSRIWDDSAWEQREREFREFQSNFPTSFSSYFLMFFCLSSSFKGRRHRALDHSLHMPIHAADSTGDTIDDIYDENSFSFYFSLEFPSHGRENCSLSELSLSFYWWKAKKISSVLSQGKNKQRRRRYQAHHY